MRFYTKRSVYEAPPVPEAALAAIDSTEIREHMVVLASDAFEGRGTGTPGEQKTIEYVREQMQAAGLVGATPDGGFFQEVSLLGSTPTDVGALTLTPEDGESVVLDFVDDYIASTDLDATEPRSTPRSYSSATASRTPATSGTTTRTST